ncbi:fungal-specific transcription factor domain-containing protein [Pseudomassariella vexata]|uniref:Fungal-specific transcription factor domain-domain-containing protein n=1 Tax=Pseudomassariella vexata TaxID=1141098 RepID=A0A1Y2EEY1_9PEZI|nr:fungal-specific transcription factor domain-containing protein [Pseudomassariella vexata]ORY69826.1 fungal-specific transcription factor domain-domain-containing protein [Pseudomassariella vexata]
MTRPRVDPEKRQRTACACDSCKRRKQKCNGLKPCNTCTKRQLQCEYTPAILEASQSPVFSPTKRRHVDGSPRAIKSSPEESNAQLHHGPARNPPLPPWDSVEVSPASLVKPELTPSIPRPRAVSTRHFVDAKERDSDSRSRMSNTSGAADEAEVYPSQRMLQDSTGRLLYLGDSATLSYLQLIRMIVEEISGESDFTRDPRRHMIMEAQVSIPPTVRPTGVLPDRRTANILVESFFTNTIGFVEVFDKDMFLASTMECYNDPLSVNPSVLCLLYLVFSIGLVIAKPPSGTEAEAIIKRLRSEDVNRAELFYRNAKSLADPVSGFEDADFWSIQALVLMSLYMLSVSKRNASYAYCGMAVRSAFALGLHREESMVLFSGIERKVRRNLWRSLFVLDRFLAASLGRPTAISEDDCSEHALEAPVEFSGPAGLSNNTERVNSAALNATVRTCHVVGITLKRVYSKRKISTTVAQEIANQLEDWNDKLDQILHWKQAMSGPVDPSLGIANLHVNLLHCHAIILLTRPFFLYILSKGHERSGGSQKSYRISQRMEKFAQTCVEASQHTLILAQNALDAEYLPHCNPFVIHFVFASGLIVLSNEFASLYHNPEGDRAIQSCISILRYCAEYDPQAERVSYIVESFHKANKTRPATARQLSLPGRRIPTIKTLVRNADYDPMAHFFQSDKAGSRGPLPPLAPGPKNGRVMLSAGLPATLPPMVPSVIQQPSPDGSNTSPVNSSGVVSSGLHGMDHLNGPEAEFDFDSLWPNWQAPTGGMALPHPHPEGHQVAEGFGTYGLGPVQVPVGHLNVPLYPTSDFR